MTIQSANPLILTLSLSPKAQEYFTQLRRKHFPVERNYIEAHLTLFHQLPAGDDTLINDIKYFAAQHQKHRLLISELVSIGNGVAFKIECEGLMKMHRQMQIKWKEVTIPQDKQKLWPHITIQNKVSAFVGQTLLQELKADFLPFEVSATGLSLWEYLGGPWRFLENFGFKEN